MSWTLHLLVAISPNYGATGGDTLFTHYDSSESNMMSVEFDMNWQLMLKDSGSVTQLTIPNGYIYPG